jgi:hypothetical protein
MKKNQKQINIALIGTLQSGKSTVFLYFFLIKIYKQIKHMYKTISEEELYQYKDLIYSNLIIYFKHLITLSEQKGFKIKEENMV